MKSSFLKKPQNEKRQAIEWETFANKHLQGVNLHSTQTARSSVRSQTTQPQRGRISWVVRGYDCALNVGASL